MSGMTHEKGSVVSFIPANFEVTVVGLEKGTDKPVTFRAFGWGVVCQGRDGWTVQTKVEPMVTCVICVEGGLVGLDSHWADAHVGAMGWVVTSAAGSGPA